jgi:hypothetical protein
MKSIFNFHLYSDEHPSKLVYIRVMSESNLGRNTRLSLLKDLMGFSVSTSKCRSSSSNQGTATYFHILSNQLFTHRPTIRRRLVCCNLNY